jgi:hypothetical protein
MVNPTLCLNDADLIFSRLVDVINESTKHIQILREQIKKEIREIIYTTIIHRDLIKKLYEENEHIYGRPYKCNNNNNKCCFGINKTKIIYDDHLRISSNGTLRYVKSKGDKASHIGIINYLKINLYTHYYRCGKKNRDIIIDLNILHKNLLTLYKIRDEK